jgi:chromate transporter
MLIVLVLSWAYVRFGSMPQAAWLLYGIKPVVIAIIFQALWKLGLKAVKGPLTAAAGLVALALDLVGVNPLLALVIGGLLVMLSANLHRLGWPTASSAWIPISAASLLPKAVSLLAPKPFSLGVLFLTFLKIGSVLYGSGYVLLAFLRAEFVNQLGWLTDQQLLDAIALGQVTPGPVFTSQLSSATLGGIPAAW